MVAADANGITYRVGLDVPVRDVAGGQEPWLLLDGTDTKSLWTGAMLPRDKLPRGRAKDRGYIVTANNDPFGFTQDGRLDNDPYYYGALFDPGFRASRITSEIAAMTQKIAVLSRVRAEFQQAAGALESCRGCHDDPRFPRQCGGCEAMQGAGVPLAVRVLWQVDHAEGEAQAPQGHGDTTDLP